MWRRRTLCLPTAAALAVLVASAPAQEAGAPAQESVPAAAPGPVERFLGRADEQLTQYVAFRRLEARNRRFKKEGWLEARTERDPQTGLRFTVLAGGGSGLIRNRVLRGTLEGEAKLIQEGEPARAAVVPDNYRFSVGEPTPDGLVRLLIDPRRKDKMLVNGELWVTPEDADLERLEGDLSKTPSWWTTRVHVVREYARVAGVRVPVRTTSTAQVRLAGTSDFQMTYRYETVNGRPVPQDPPTTASPNR
jgi:hypothetical protein